MNNLLKGWHPVRFIRLLLGLVVMVQGIFTREWVLMLPGTLLALSALANSGCCAGTACAPRKNTTNTEQPEDIIFEEVEEKHRMQ